jgi:hypothetical protein
VNSLNAWPMHEASSIRFINESVYMVKKSNACVYFYCLGGGRLCGVS